MTHIPAQVKKAAAELIEIYGESIDTSEYTKVNKCTCTASPKMSKQVFRSISYMMASRLMLFQALKRSI